MCYLHTPSNGSIGHLPIILWWRNVRSPRVWQNTRRRLYDHSPGRIQLNSLLRRQLKLHPVSSFAASHHLLLQFLVRYSSAPVSVSPRHSLPAVRSTNDTPLYDDIQPPKAIPVDIRNSPNSSRTLSSPANVSSSRI